jgi:hypothetical protein
MLWEVAQFRRRFFDLEDLPEQMAKSADLGDVNVTFVPTTSAVLRARAALQLMPKPSWTCLDSVALRGSWDALAVEGFFLPLPTRCQVDRPINSRPAMS